MAFIILGFCSIYFKCYNEKDLFNALVSIFAAIIGGAITLVGVAWTINDNKEDRRREAIEKAMPYFTFNMVLDEPHIVDGIKICFPESADMKYDYPIYGEIENSNHSVMILKRIYHDANWFYLSCNNTLIQNGKVVLHFKFSSPIDIVLEVADVLGNLYYYKLNVLHVALLNKTKIGIHTIIGVEMIDVKDVIKEKDYQS